MHFESIASDYAVDRPPYPSELFELLLADGVIGPGKQVLEVGPGSGLATAPLAASGSDVVAVEPGPDLADLLLRTVPEASVVVAALEDADLGAGQFDSVVAATSMHWLDLDAALPRLHGALRAGGWLAVWRHVFQDDTVAQTPFRERVQAIADARPDSPGTEQSRPNRSTMAELSAGGLFTPIRTERWRWSVSLDVDAVARLFGTFPGWTADEVRAVARAAEDLGGTVVEHYQTVLHLLRRADGP